MRDSPIITSLSLFTVLSITALSLFTVLQVLSIYGAFFVYSTWSLTLFTVVKYGIPMIVVTIAN